MSRPSEATDYSVNVCPLYDDDGETGGLCAYAHSPYLKDAMLMAGSAAEEWLRSPDEGDEADGEPPRVPCGFEVTVSLPGFPDPA